MDYGESLFKISTRHPNTCSWLTENKDFTNWISGLGPNTFWLHGYPGLGKSVLAKYVVAMVTEKQLQSSSLKETDKSMVAYYFCSDRDQNAKSLRDLLCSIIHQLIFCDPKLAEPITAKWQIIDSGVTESLTSLWTILSLVLSATGLRQVYIIVDALDEMAKNSWARYLDGMHNIVNQTESRARLFITSRNEPEIKTQISQWHVSNVELGEIPQNHSDVSTFLTDSVLPYGVEHSFSKEAADAILAELVRRAAGMFLHAKLAWAHFTDGVGSWTRNIIDERFRQLQLLPPGLDALYYRILQSADKRFHSELSEVLKWVVFSKRPLTVSELSVALALRAKPWRSKDIDTRISLREFLKKRLPHLIKVSLKDNVTLIHQSFKDFLLQTAEVQLENDKPSVSNSFYLNGKVEYEIAADCVTYLGLEDFQHPFTNEGREIQTWVDYYGRDRMNEEFTRHFIFIDYAYCYWWQHLRPEDTCDEIWICFKRILNYHPKSRPMLPPSITPLFFLSERSVWVLMRRMIDQGFDINVLGICGNHILHHSRVSSLWVRKDYTTVDSLISLGADINGKDSHGRTILHRLVTEGQTAELRKWLKRPLLDVNSQDNNGQTATHIAARVESLLSDTLLEILFSIPEVDVNVQDYLGRTPLTLAIHWGKDLSTKKLLSHPRIDITSSRIRGESPLINAAIQGWTEIVLSLLQNIPNVDRFFDSTGRTILHWTIMMGMMEAFKICLSKQRTIIDWADNRGMTALHYAAQDGAFEAVNLLLERMCTISKTKFGETPLHLAASRGHHRILELLLTNFPRTVLNEKDNMGWTITHRAVTSGNDNLIKFLLDQEDLDLTRKDHHGRAAVAFAASYASEAVLQMFLNKRGKDVRSRDSFGNTLLHLAIAADNVATIPYLLDYTSIRKNTDNHWDKLALDYAPASSNMLEFLLDQGLVHSDKYRDERERYRVAERALRDKLRAAESKFHTDWLVGTWVDHDFDMPHSVLPLSTKIIANSE